MARWKKWLCPYWATWRHRYRDDADRLYLIDDNTTIVAVTNATASNATVELVFYERRGDGNFYESDWAGGSWLVPPKYQIIYKPDPSRIFGDSFSFQGWFFIYSNQDISFYAYTEFTRRNMISGGSTPEAGGVVHNVARASLSFYQRPYSLSEMVGLTGTDLIDSWRGYPTTRFREPGSRPSTELPGGGDTAPGLPDI